MNKTVLQYVGMTFVAAMVMSMQLTPAIPKSARAAATSPLSTVLPPTSTQARDDTGGRVVRPQGSAQRIQKDALERRGDLRLPVARGVVQA